MKRNWIKYVVIVLVMVVAGVIYSCGNKESIALSGDEEVSLEIKENTSVDGESLSETAGETKEDKAEKDVSVENENDIPKSAYIYVCGAVNQPNVYELKSDKRVIDAINAAGGFSDDADTDYLNLADVLIDGEKIYVPTKEEVEESKVPETISTVTVGSGAGQNSSAGIGGEVGSTSQKVNINTATAEELKTLNGIGDKRAQDIINYRNSHDRFNTIEDIMLVPGIKDAVFSKICDYIEV